MRTRTHKYQDNDNCYVDTTCYDENSNYLDLGYQRLRIINIKLYPEFSHIRKLFVDHNNLNQLPDPHYLPHLEQLTCSVNSLTSIPFYPKLTFLNIAHNRIVDCSQYHNSSIRFFDCSNNPNFKLNFTLRECEQLYINNTEISSIDLNFVPKLKVIDCSNNHLSTITGGSELIEIDIKFNKIKSLPRWDKIERIMADQNLIDALETYPNLISVNISYNQLVDIATQPKLKKLIAHNNNLRNLGSMPNLEMIDLRHNNLTDISISDGAEFVSLQFNPIKKIILNKNVLKTIKELQVNFETYKYIYQNYYQNFDSVNIQINEEKLEYLLKKLGNVFNDKMIRYVFRQFCAMDFREREDALFKIAINLYCNYFPTKGINSVEELAKNSQFKHLLDNITKFYYKTVVATLYFNGYIN